ncbi:MAG: hypothetical protein L3J18_08610 [Candidatus Brocadia sp.]|nr:MAG: hypothetical protein L3J18_08610 [Candidatus Brocadia sp.]
MKSEKNAPMNLFLSHQGVNCYNPVLPRIKKVFSKGYYWVLDQGEYATDVMFKDRQSLREIYPELVEHALVNFNASDVMTFLGRKLTGNFRGEIITDEEKTARGSHQAPHEEEFPEDV